MNALQLFADWKPKASYQASQRELETQRVQAGSQVWHNPRLEFGQVAMPQLQADEVLLEVAAVGICGSDMQRNVYYRNGRAKNWAYGRYG